MFSVVFELDFVSNCFIQDMLYHAGEIDYFHIFLTASSMSEAYDRAVSYSLDHYEDADVRILSLVRIS